MPNVPEAQNPQIHRDTEMDFKKFFSAVRDRYIIIIILTTVILAGVLFYNSTLVPIYRATTQLMIEIPEFVGHDTKEAKSPTIGSSDYFNSQYEILRSVSLARKIAEKLDLKALPEFQGKIPELALQEMITVKPVKNSRIVMLSVESSRPELAANIANALADIYIQQNIEGMMFMSKEILRVISGEHGLPEPGMPSDILPSAAERQKIIQMLPSVVNNPEILNLRKERSGIESQIAQLSKRYKPKHPRMIALNTQLGSINEQIKARTDEVIASVKAELEGKLRPNNIRILDRAQTPKIPIDSPKIPNILKGILAGILLGLGLIYLLEKIDTTVKTQEDVQQSLRLPFFGDFPFLKGGDKMMTGPESLLKLDSNIPASNAIREIRIGLNFLTIKNTPPKTFLITSSVPKEGKSLLAVYLAFSFAKSGANTLLIDADLRLPKLHYSMNVRQSPGFADLLRGTMSPDSVIVRTGIPDLSILTAGQSNDNPSELFSRPNVPELFHQLSSQYDKIIIDSPPSLMIPDALLLARIVESTILVIRSGKLSANSIVKLKEKFDAIGAPLTGFILNGSRLEKIQHYSSYYKSYYNKAHATKKKPAFKPKNKKPAIVPPAGS